MKSRTFTRITKVLLLAVLFLLVGMRGWASTYYNILANGLAINYNDGNYWSNSSGGSPVGGTISWGASDIMVFDGNSGNPTINFDANLTISAVQVISGLVTFIAKDLDTQITKTLTLSGTNCLSIASTKSLTLGGEADVDPAMVIQLTGTNATIDGALGGVFDGSTLIISQATTLTNTGVIYGISSATKFSNLVINGILNTSNYVNSSVITIGTSGLLRTSWISTQGWWRTSYAPVSASLNGTVEYNSTINNQMIGAAAAYNHLVISGSQTKKLSGNTTVNGNVTVNAGNTLDINGKTLEFLTNVTNDGILNSSLTGNVLKFNGSTAQSFSGSGTQTVETLQINSTNVAGGVTISSNNNLIASNVKFSNTASLNNGTKLTIGTGGATGSTITYIGSVSHSVGNFNTIPTFNLGSLGLTIDYQLESTPRTTGLEMPSSFSTLLVTNPNGVLLNNAETVTNAVTIGSGGILNLNGRSLTFQGNTFTNQATLLGTTGSTVTFEKAGTQTLSLTNSTSTLIDILKVDNTGLTVSAASNKSLIANNVYFNNSGGITNTSTTTTIGSGASAIIEFNNTHGGSCGNFGVAPTFNVSNSGSNGLTVNYKTESANRTIGVEMPATAANIYISNTNGITDNGSYSLTGTLNIAAGYLQINPNKDMTVNGATTITPASGIKIKSSSAGTGSLITNGSVGGTGTTYIERYITGSTAVNGALKYHQVSVPLIGDQNGNTCYFSAVWMHSFLFDYTESTDNWFNWNSGTGNFCPTNKGYLIYHRLWPGQATADTTYTMTGKLNTGSYSPPVTKVGNGFNLIPNPYPSSINWNASSGWSFNNMSSAIWLYNATSNNYATVLRTGSGTIASGTGTSSAIQVGQAFFVKAISTNPTVSMNDNVRIHNSSQGFLKNSDAIANSLRLNIQGNSSADEILVNFVFDATPGYDSHYDAEKFTGPETSPQLSALNPSSDKYSIIGLPLSSDETVLPLNLNMNYSGELTFTASQLESFTTGTSIKLEDKQLAKTIDLRSTPAYSFTHTPDDADDRFVLHFGSVLGFDDNHALLTSSVTVNGKQISVSYPTTSGKHLSASIFDTQGRLLKQVSLNGTGNDSFTLSETSGVYLLRLTLPGGNETHKIVVL